MLLLIRPLFFIDSVHANDLFHSYLVRFSHMRELFQMSSATVLKASIWCYNTLKPISTMKMSFEAFSFVKIKKKSKSI